MDTIEFKHKLPNGDRIHVVASGNVYCSEYYQPAHVTSLHIDPYTSDDADARQIYKEEIGEREWLHIEQIAVNKLVGQLSGEDCA